MPVFLISDVTVKNPAAFEAYRSRAARSIARHGGRYRARGGEVQTLEGTWAPRTVIVVEFSDFESARKWYRSADYETTLAFRDEALSRNLILIDGTNASD
jgi:uncharacterized protein (DUF1330 family)